MLEAVKLKGVIKSDRQLTLPKLPTELPEGEVEIILLYERKPVNRQIATLTPLNWPVLEGGQYLGGALRREELYNDGGR